MRMYSLTETDLQITANQIKEIVVAGMTADGFIGEDVAKVFVENYAIVVVRKGWFGQLMDKMLGGFDNDETKYVVVKRVTSNKPILNASIPELNKDESNQAPIK